MIVKGAPIAAVAIANTLAAIDRPSDVAALAARHLVVIQGHATQVLYVSSMRSVQLYCTAALLRLSGDSQDGCKWQTQQRLTIFCVLQCRQGLGQK
jgi:hypothetical protein